MARPRSISDDEILAAARVVFLEKGITATAGDVAVRCGVGEATIFRRFPTKQALFLAAIETGAPPDWVYSLSIRLHRQDVAQNLKELGLEIIEFQKKFMPLIMMKMTNPGVCDMRRRQSMFTHCMRAMTDFFAAQIRAGRIKTTHARTAAATFMGAIHNFVISGIFEPSGEPMPPQIFLKHLVAMLAHTQTLSPSNRPYSKLRNPKLRSPKLERVSK